MKKLIIWAVLLCLLLTACTQAAPPEQLDNATGTTTVPSTPASTTIPTTKPATNHDLNAPPKTLLIRSMEKYDALKQAIKQESISETEIWFVSDAVFTDKKELEAFINLLDSLPVPVIEGAELSSVDFYPTMSSVYFAYPVTDNHWYRFEYLVDKEKGVELKQRLSEEGRLLEQEIMVNADVRCTVLTQFKQRWEGSAVYTCWVEIDGWLAYFNYRNDVIDLSTVDISDLLETISIGTEIQLKKETDNPLPNVSTTFPQEHTTTPKTTYTLPGTIPTTMPGTTNPYISQ